MEGMQTPEFKVYVRAGVMVGTCRIRDWIQRCGQSVDLVQGLGQTLPQDLHFGSGHRRIRF